MTTIGEKIREARTERGMTQSELAADLVTPSMISQIEGDRSRPSFPLLKAIANRLSLPVEYFLDDLEQQYSTLAFVHLARYYLMTGRSGEALQVLLDSPRPQPPGEAYEDYLLALTDAQRLQGRYRDAITNIEELREYALRGQDMRLQFSVCRLAGYIEYDTDNIIGAMHEWKTARKLGEALEPATGPSRLPSVTIKADLAEIYTLLSEVYQKQGDTLRANNLLDKAARFVGPSSTLQSLAQSLVDDGLALLDVYDASRALELFQRAASMTKAAHLVERSARISSLFSRSVGESAPDPWLLASVAMVSVSPERFFDGELRAIGDLLENGEMKAAEERLEGCERVLSALEENLMDDNLGTQSTEVFLCRQRVLEMEAHLSHQSGALDIAVQKMQKVLDQLNARNAYSEWLRCAATLVKWQIEAGEDTRVYELVTQMEKRYVALESERKSHRFKIALSTAGTTKWSDEESDPGRLP